MNKNLYRIIFNKPRGLLMAVAENVGGGGKAAGASDVPGQLASPAILGVLRPVCCSVLLAFGLAASLSDIAQAQVVADPGAPANQQPTVVTSANGTVQVNIQSPSAAGVSRNAYSQFDVNQQGVILNNARTNVQTQLGGWVQGNPWLAAGTARVILNEVNSSNPSQLRGYVEVAGDRAQVVIANPAGISCDGCGFLNANRVTLTTGTPIVNSGNLEGYRVQQGAVTVEGAGMDTSRADYTDIIARSVQVNAGIWANTLKLSAGANEVNAGHTQITPVAASGAAPAYAIDVANLGGMYAGKIFLTGSESGVGVRNSGLIAAAAGDVIVTSDGLLENGGRIASAGDAHLDANGGIVNSGIVYAQGAARIVAQGMIDNKGGDIQAQGNISIDVGTGRVDNTGSLIRSGGALDIRAASVENANTQGADQGIEAQLVDIAAGQINNQSGAIRAAASLALTGSGALENTLGLISSGQTLAILDRDLASKTLAITNTGGTLIAGTSLNVDSATLSGDGDVLSQGDLAVRLSGDYVHTGNLLANGNASLETAGNVTNLAAMQAGNGLAISAANIDNTASGQISATTTHVSADGTLINRGLIDGQETAITANAVSNLGTGRIYGDHLSIGATTLANDAENGAAPVIAARNRLDIGAQTITNREHALIFSAGDMAIGGNLDANKQATGQAATLNNASATIEALGSLTLSAYQINNTNEHFSTQVVPVSSQSFNEFQGEGAGTRYPASSVYQHHVRDSFYQWVIGGIAYNRSYQYDYTRTITETQVQSSDPAQILSGGAMNLSANSLLNDKSRIIAGGALTGNLGSLTNSEVAGERVSTEAGTAYHYIDHQPGGCCNDWTEIQITGYNPAPSVAGISLTPTVYQQNTAPNGSGTAIGTLAIASVNQSAGGANPTPLSSLFNSAPNPNAGYLIETDPRFASYRTWLSSDYLLNALEIDPAITHKRLGDGFYEQKLVREQVAQLTGRRFLDGYANDEAQYQALLGNAVTYAQAHQLRPGVALSAGQMAQLTSDIVWLVEKTVTLPNGQTTQALVPQLYMRVRDGDLQTSGALLAASSVSLNLSGDLSNSGTIAGRSVVSLSAENVRNLGGRISGNDLGIQARTDLDNIGGTIEAMHTLSASAGRDLNVLSTTRTQTNAQGSRTHIDRVAGLYVTGSGGTLMATAGRDLNLDAAAILNAAASPSPLAEEGAGSTTLAAGNNLKLGTVSEAQQHDLAWDSRNYRKENSRSDIGTTIQTQGDLRLSAGNDLNAKAASVTSEQGELLATAGRNITLSAGEANDQRDEASYSQSRGNWGSKKTVATRDTLNETTALTSTFTGKTAVLDAGNDIHIEGGQIKALNTIALLAGNDIHLTAAENTRTESHLRDEKTSGLSTRGYKKQSNEASDTLDQITHSGSRLGSETGNIVLAANLNNTQDMNKGLILIEGSEIRAGNGKIDLTGQHIILTASEDLSSSERTRKESNRTWAFATGLPSGTQHGLDAVGQSRTLNGSTLQSAQGITLDAQGVIDITASQLKADQGDIDIKGAEVSLQSGLNSSQSISKETSKKTGISLKDLTGTFTPGQGIGYKTALTEEKANTTLAPTRLDAQNIHIQSTAGDITLAAVEAHTPGTLTLDAARDLNLASLATSEYQSLDLKKKDLAWQSVKGSGTQDETTRYTRLNAGQLQISAGNRISADMSVKDSAQILANEPGMDWLKQIQEDPRLNSQIDWNRIEEAHQKWDYDQQGLTPAAAVVVAIVVTWLTAGAAAEAGAAVVNGAAGAGAATAGGGAMAATMVQVGITTLASQASVSLINNQGDIGATLHELGSQDNLRQLAIAMVTAGALKGIGDTFTIDGKALNTISVKDGFAANAGKNLINGLARATLTSAVTGTDLETSLRTEVIASLLNAASAQGANWIGDQAQTGQINEFGRAFAHAVAGCMAGAAGASAPGSNTSAGSGCGAGALGAVVGELSAGLYNSGRAEAGLLPKTDTVAFASMMGGIAAAVAGQDAQGIAIASSTGANAAENNYLTHAQEAQRDKELEACKKSLACEIGVKLNYAGISIKQETGLIVGVFGGMGYQTYEQGVAVVEMVKNLPETLTALKAIVNDPEFRAKVGNQIADDYQQRIDMQTRAYNEGGWDGSITAGVEAGRLAVDVLTVGSAAVGAGKLIAMTAKAGATLVGEVGTLARSLSSAGKSSISEFIPALGKTTTVTQADGAFATQGLNIDPMRLPDGVKMVRELEKSGLSTQAAIDTAESFIRSGSTPPIATPLDITDKLVKVVPAGGRPSASTGYWMRESELVVLRQDPANLANKLGLPPGMQAAQFDVYQITPRQGAVVFESTIAPTTVNGIQNTFGGARQAIVLDRNQFTLPAKVGSIKAN